jgi:hypothetical protein
MSEPPSPAIRSPCLLAIAALALALGRPRPPGLSGADVSMGGDGELYFVRQGTYGELFPGQGLADPRNMPSWPSTSSARIRPSSDSWCPGPRRRTWSRQRLDPVRGPERHPLRALAVRDQRRALAPQPGGLRERRVDRADRDLRQPLRLEELAAARRDPGLLPAPRRRTAALRSWNRTVVHLLWWEEGPSASRWRTTPRSPSSTASTPAGTRSTCWRGSSSPRRPERWWTSTFRSLRLLASKPDATARAWCSPSSPEQAAIWSRPPLKCFRASCPSSLTGSDAQIVDLGRGLQAATPRGRLGGQGSQLEIGDIGRPPRPPSQPGFTYAG